MACWNGSAAAQTGAPCRIFLHCPRHSGVTAAHGVLERLGRRPTGAPLSDLFTPPREQRQFLILKLLVGKEIIKLA
jgi:hypothetical protein